MIELFGMSSPNVRKAGIMLEELGLDYVLHHVAVMRGDQFEPQFKAMNPLSKVPVLLDHDKGGGKPIFESGAILFYLAETYSGFLPASGMERYEVMQWVMVQMASIGPMLGQLNHFNLVGDQIDPYSRARYHTQSERLYRILDERLADREWIAGGTYSIADMAIYPWATYLEQHRFEPVSHPALMRWRDKIAARDAVKRSWDRFGEAFNAQTAATMRAATTEQLDKFFWRDANSPKVDYSAVNRR